jgi:hypothetical protein
MGQAQGDNKGKLQKFNWFTGINVSQLLKEATKMFVSPGGWKGDGTKNKEKR